MQVGGVAEAFLRQTGSLSSGLQVLSKLLSGFHPVHAELTQTKSLQTKPLI